MTSEERREGEVKGKEGKKGENDLTPPCREFLATPLGVNAQLT